MSVDLLWVDAGATETLGMTLAAGEGFTENMEPRNGYFVLSQAAVQVAGMGVCGGCRWPDFGDWASWGHGRLTRGHGRRGG